MPTGYTAAVTDGITFEQFALRCARNFGALVMMRDEPMDAPIPVFEPTAFYREALVKAQQELDRVLAMTLEEADAASEAAWNLAEEQRRKRVSDNTALLAKYSLMLAQVEAWTPPTPDHQGLKVFMIEQLRQSIDFDCSFVADTEPTAVVTGEEHREALVTKLKRDVAYYTEEAEKEDRRTQTRNDWVSALKASLAQQPLTYFTADGTLMNRDGTRSIFDDVDQ